MESPKTPTRVTRTRGKLTSAGDTPASSADAEMAPNLNGNKDGGVETENVAKEGGRVTRKRKLTELKSDEEGKVLKDTAARTKDEVKPEASTVDELKMETHTEDMPKLEIKIDEEPKSDVAADEPRSETTPKVETVLVPATNDKDVKQEECHNTVPEEIAMDSTDLNSSTDFSAAEEPAVADSVGNDLKTGSGSETYGKGKRARVPNKRYSDIIRTTGRTPKPDTPYVSRGGPHRTPIGASVKNGEFPDDDLVEILREESLEANKEVQPASPRKPIASAKKPPKPTIDVSSNPAYLKPFKYGWRRELVLRSTYTDGKRNGDIYYYHPSGRKLRSMREVSEHLTREVSLDNFTFAKEVVGVDDPEKEIIREAKKVKGQPISNLQMNRKMTSKLILKAKKRPKPPVDTPPAEPSPPKSPKIAKQSSSFKIKPPVKQPTVMKKGKKESAESKVAAAPSWNKKGKSNVDRKPCLLLPCSIRCEGMQGLVPCLQCRICLCLYHNECVGISHQIGVRGYVCKNCQLEQDPNDEKSGTNLSAAPNLLPQTNSTHFPPSQASVANSDSLLVPGRQNVDANNADLSPGTKLKLNNNNTEQKSLVGSLTTWFPQSSTIQVGNNESDPLTNVPRRPQLVEYIGNKKYVVVPRHSILSVRSPAQADAANAVINASVKAQSEPIVDSEPPKSPNENTSCIRPTADQEECKEEASTPSTAADEKVPEPVKTVAKSAVRPKTTHERPAPRPGPPNFMNTYMQNLQYGYTTLFCVFQYLKVQDLLRAGCVCTMWRDMSRYPALWRTVRMKNSQIHSFEGMANALREHGTVHLDLRKMLLPSNATDDDIWPSFTNAIKKVESLRRIELCRCLASVVEDLARNNHNLEVINAVTIKCDGMTFEPFENLTNLVDLRLKSTAGLTLSSDLSALKALTKLKHLSITSIKDLNKLNIEVISDLVNLEVLDLGECTDFPKHFGSDILSKLTKLEKLRLEKGQGDCHAFDILEAVKGLPGLQQLELVNFDIKAGFDKTLGACYNIKKLLIIPTYISQSATTNHMVLGGVLRLQKTLSHFVWGVTLELLRVTQLFVSQQSTEQPEKREAREKETSESIPVLKPVPLHGIPKPEVVSPSDTPQVEILPLSNLKNLLLQNLPNTRVKIVKIPFHSTWRQSITDSVN